MKHNVIFDDYLVTKQIEEFMNDYRLTAWLFSDLSHTYS